MAAPATDDAGTAVVMPTAASTGPQPGTVFTDLQAADIQPNTTYTARRVINFPMYYQLPGPVSFVDCLIEGSLGTYYPFDFVRVQVNGEFAPSNTGGHISQSKFAGGNIQGLRPAGVINGNPGPMSLPIVVEDSYIVTTPGVPEQHLEAMQSLYANDLTFNNVVFIMEGPPNGTQTGDINHAGNNARFIDCWFLGDAGYAIYSDGTTTFTRPRFSRSPDRFGLVYNDHLPGRVRATFVDAMWADDLSPVAPADLNP
jgi:hypothetical protein